MNNSRPAAVLLLLLAAIATSACSGGKPHELRIGVVVAQTGASGERGKDLLNGATLAVEEINAGGLKIDGKPFLVRIESTDDRGDVALSKEQALTLLDAGVNAIIGPLNTPQALAVIPAVSDRHVPQLITATGASLVSLGKGNVFRLLAGDDKQGVAMAAFAAETSTGKHIATLTEKSDYGRGLSKTFVTALKGKGLVPALSMELDDDTLPADLAARLKAANIDLLALFVREPQLVKVIDALGSAHENDITLLGTNVIRNRSVARRALTVKALYATATAIDASEYPNGTEFLERFRRRFAADPVWGAQISYDGVYALVDAARKAGSIDGDDLVKALKQIEPATQVNQQMRFAPSGEQAYPAIAVYKMEHGAWALQMMSSTW
jgi:branched-chain amino acid transport system substrate-binding protein